jgi:hypothetical protein
MRPPWLGFPSFGTELFDTIHCLSVKMNRYSDLAIIRGSVKKPRERLEGSPLFDGRHTFGTSPIAEAIKASMVASAMRRRPPRRILLKRPSFAIL